MTARPTARADVTPGDVGRFAIHADPTIFAAHLAQWCGDDIELNAVATWLTVVADRLRLIRESL